MKKPLSILYVSEYFPPFAPGGGEWSTLRWAQLLTECGHAVRVATVNFGAPSREKLGEVEIRRVAFPFKLPPGQQSAPFYSTRNPLFILYFGLFVYQLAREADVVHAQSENVLVPAWLGARLARKPVFFTIRDTGLLCPLGGVCLISYPTVPADCGLRRLITIDAQFYQRHYLRYQHWLSRLKLVVNLSLQWPLAVLKKLCLNQMAGIIPVSQGIANVYPTHVLRARDRVHAIHNPPPSITPPSQPFEAIRAEWKLDGHFVVLSVGKLSLGKGTHVLIEAARQMEQAGDKDTVFMLVGKGIIRNEIPSNVRLLGSLPHDQVMDLYHVADVVVVPSVWPEPLSRTILEAMAAGKPVIGTDVGGTPELIHSEITGLIVPPGDALALMQAITRLKQRGDLRYTMGKQAQQAVVRRLDSESSVQQLVDVYLHSTIQENLNVK